MTLDGLRREDKEPDQRRPAGTWTVDGPAGDERGVEYQEKGSGTKKDGIDNCQHKHTKVPEGSSPLQGPNTPDRSVDVHIDLHPHTAILAEQICPGSNLQPNSPTRITHPSVAILQSLCRDLEKSASNTQACIFEDFMLPAGKTGVLIVDFLGSAMPSRADLQAAKPRSITRKRRKHGGAANKTKRAKVDTPSVGLPAGAETADKSATSGVNVPVILVPSLAAFNRQVAAISVPVEPQSARGAKKIAQEGKHIALQPSKARTPGQPPKDSSHESAAGTSNDNTVPAPKMAPPLDPPAPPCPSTRESRRASAPAVMTKRPAERLPARSAPTQDAAPDTPGQQAQAEPEQDASAPVARPSNAMQIEESPQAPGKESTAAASQPGEADAEGETAEAQMEPRPISMPDLDVLCNEPALNEPGTPAGQACAVPGAALASASLSPPAELTKFPSARAGGWAKIAGHGMGDTHLQTLRQEASMSPQSLDADSVLQTASCAAASEPPKSGAAAATAAAAHGGGSSCSSKNSHAQKKNAKQQAYGGAPDSPDKPRAFELDPLPLDTAALPHQRQHGDRVFSGQLRPCEVHSQSSMWLQAGGEPLQGGGSEEQDLHSTPFAHEQCYPQQHQQLAAAAEHDALGPLLGPIFGADIGADPMAMDEDMALFDSDLANAWHQEAADIRASMEPRRVSFGQQLGSQELPMGSQHQSRRLSVPSTWCSSATPQLFLTPSSRHVRQAEVFHGASPEGFAHGDGRAEGQGCAPRRAQLSPICFTGYQLSQPGFTAQNGYHGSSQPLFMLPTATRRSPVPDLELLELRQIAANLQRLLCLNLSGRDDSAADPAGVAASQSLLLLLETLQRIPITWQLLQQSQVALCVRACCQHGNQHVALTARHLLEKWQLILEAMGPEPAFSPANARHPPLQQNPAQHRTQQSRKERPAVPSQAQLFGQDMHLGSSMGGVSYTMEGMAEADAINLAAFPEFGGGGVPEDAAPDRGRSLAEGGLFGPPGRIARSVSSRLAQAAPPEPITRAATVAAVPAPLLGGGRARPRPHAAGKGAKSAAADTRPAPKNKKAAAQAKKRAGGSRGTGNFTQLRGIAALERQLQQLKASAAASGDIDWSGDLRAGLPEPEPANFGSQPPWATTSAPLGRVRSAGLQDNLPANAQRLAAKSAALGGALFQSQAFWASEPGVNVMGLGEDFDADGQDEGEPSSTSVRLTRQASRARQNRPGGSSEGTLAQTPTASSAEDAASRGTGKALWSDADKARYIAVLQEHGRDLASLCAAFPDKSAKAVRKFYANNKQRLGLGLVLEQAGFDEAWQ